MNRLLILLLNLFGIVVVAQPIPQTTAYMRSVLLGTNAADARRLLGFSSVFANTATIVVDGTAGNDATGSRGRIDLPFATFDRAITNAQVGDIIYIRPGEYTTLGGVHGSKIPSGVSIVGSGMGNTTLRLIQTSTTARHAVLSTTEDDASSNIYVGHLTLDGGSTNTWEPTAGKANGLVLYGNNNMADSLHVINCVGATNGGAAYEAFGIIVGSPSGAYATCSNTIVANCVVDTGHYSGSEWANGTAIIVVNGAHITVSGNRILTAGIALGVAAGGKDLKFLDNHIDYSLFGVSSDSGLTNSNIEFSRNYFHGIGATSWGVNWRATATTNLVFRENFWDNYTTGLLITNSGSGYTHHLVLQDNTILAGVNIMHLAYVTNAMISGNMISGSAFGDFTACNYIWGDLTRSYNNGLPYTNTIFDQWADDMTVRGTLTATNAVLVGATLTTPKNASFTNLTVSTLGLPLLPNGMLRVFDGGVESVTSSADIADFISDEVGSGSIVFNTNPLLSTGLSTTNFTEGTPTNTTNAFAYIQISVNGTNVYLPVYQ